MSNEISLMGLTFTKLSFIFFKSIIFNSNGRKLMKRWLLKLKLGRKSIRTLANHLKFNTTNLSCNLIKN